MAKGDPALKRRILSAAVMLPVVLLCVVYDVWSFALLAAVMAILLAKEWRHLVGARSGQTAGDLAGMAAGGAALLVLIMATMGWAELGLLVAFFCAFSSAIIAQLGNGAPFWTSIGVLYLSLPMLALVWLRAIPDVGLQVMLWLLMVVWATDIMAYFVGRGLGGPRLAPSISPGKTWSGLCGGMAGAAVAGALVALATGPFRILPSLGLAAGLAVVAQMGDLAESALKRRAGVKDSSDLIPGHGGVLDRVDGLLFAAPVLALAVAIARIQGWP
ncbi:MAG: phosphatidate cytidylyltransferase [Geminicoccaceae bacterium]